MHICCKHGFYIFIDSGITELSGVKKYGEHFSFLCLYKINFLWTFFQGPFSQPLGFLNILIKKGYVLITEMIISVMSWLHVFDYASLTVDFEVKELKYYASYFRPSGKHPTFCLVLAVQ